MRSRRYTLGSWLRARHCTARSQAPTCRTHCHTLAAHVVCVGRCWPFRSRMRRVRSSLVPHPFPSCSPPACYGPMLAGAGAYNTCPGCSPPACQKQLYVGVEAYNSRQSTLLQLEARPTRSLPAEATCTAAGAAGPGRPSALRHLRYSTPSCAVTWR